jgi:hypothetical protein
MPLAITDFFDRLIDRFNWTSIIGALSALPCGYFWGCGFGMEFFHITCRGNVGLVMVGILLAFPSSAVAGTYGSRGWYLVTLLSASTLLFVVLRLH